MKVALMFYGNRETRETAKLDEHRLGPTAEAMRAEGLEPEAAVYNDDFADEVRDQLLKVDAVQVWVNPITEDGRTREKLDAMLREVADSGVLVKSHPDTIQNMGTKEVLYKTREMAWGSDVRRYASMEDTRAGLLETLRTGPRVVKQFRGHSGQGIWKLTPTSDPSRILARHAPRGSEERELALDKWIESCAAYFETGPMFDQPYNPRITEGTIRCYFVSDKLEGFGHQEVNALVPGADSGPRLYFPPDRPDFQMLRRQAEAEWIPQLMSTVGVSRDDLPMLWDIDLMFADSGYMLCEINVSSVYPYPESAIRPLARAFRVALESR
jgi:hypothetical protein